MLIIATRIASFIEISTLIALQKIVAIFFPDVRICLTNLTQNNNG